MMFKTFFLLFLCCFTSTVVVAAGGVAVVGVSPAQQLVLDRIAAMRAARDILGSDDLHLVSDEVSGFMDAIMALQPQERAPILDDLGAKVGMIVPKFGRHNPFKAAQISGAFGFLLGSFREDVQTARDITAQQMAPKHGRVLTRAEEEILVMVDAMPKELSIKSARVFVAHMAQYPGNINGPISRCMTAISALAPEKRELLLAELGKRIIGIKYKVEYVNPDGEAAETRRVNDELDRDFRARLKTIETSIEKAIEDAKNPPPPVVEVDERLDPTPVVVPLAPAIDTAAALVPEQIRHYADERNQLPGTELDGLPGAFVDNTRVAFETRLINYAISHMTARYKPEGVAWITAPIRARLGIALGLIEGAHHLDPIMQRKEKVAFVESLLHSLYANQVGLIPTTVDDITIIMGLPGNSNVLTRMEKIKGLPSVNWTEVIEKYVLDVNGALRERMGEDESAYWRRIGDYVIGVYKAKIKPHINPDGLLATLTANQDLPLVPLSPMFPAGIGDATTVFESLTRVRRAGDPGFRVLLDGEGPLPSVVLEAEVPMDIRDDIFNFEVSVAKLGPKDARFKNNLAKAYQRVDDYMMQTLAKLFGTTDPIREGLSWEWGWVDFSAERVELCQKVLLTFHNFNRPGENYNLDVADIAAFAGRGTHCGDGKKTAIEATASRTLCALSGEEVGIAIDSLDALLEKTVFSTLKSRTIDALVEGHDHRENVTMTAMIRHRNQEFWRMPTDIVPKLNLYAYKESDYGIDTKDGFAAPNTDKVLQHSYQYVYVGPHELVNTIYDFLQSGTAQSRKDFMGFACKMLSEHRPFEDLMNNAPAFFDACVKERYCVVVVGGKQDPRHQRVKPEEDFIFTRKGIETLLFYAKYLAWNGPAAQHPLKVDWEESLKWLRKASPDTYRALYKDPAEVD